MTIDHFRVIGSELDLKVQLRLRGGVFSNADDIYLILMIFPLMSLHSKLVPVHSQKYECGLLDVLICLCGNVSPLAWI